jgi:hypothetical protein
MTIRNFLCVAVLTVSLIVFGCSQTIDFSTPYHLTSTDKTTVSLHSSLHKKVETSSVMGENGTYLLGPALDHAFQNNQQAPISLEYVSSDLRITPGTSIVLSGMFTANYKLLTKGVTGTQRTILIEATGTGVSYLNSYNAGQEAIEKAIIDLQNKVKVVAAGGELITNSDPRVVK